MSVDPQLIHLLACPDCKGRLIKNEAELECALCHRLFPIEKNIPWLYPKTLDISHLREETLLAEIMLQAQTGKRARFNVAQWNLSKLEFWDMVQQHLGEPPLKILYIGCGYDRGFQRFQAKGYYFVNFDLIMDILETLIGQHKAQYCVAGDMKSLPFQPESFDAVISIDGLHHESENMIPILQSFTSLLKPEGMLFIEDINAWGLFQFAKSIFIPKPVYRFLRSLCHRFKLYHHHSPAPYEFPTIYWKVKKNLKTLGFTAIKPYPIRAYPHINPINYQIYRFLCLFKPVQRYLNYHYMLSAIKKSKETVCSAEK